MRHFTTLTRAGDRSVTGQTMTKEIIKELDARFDDVGRAPITFGRTVGRAAPKAGNIKSVASSNDGSELRAVVEPVAGMKGRLEAEDLDDLELAVARTSNGGFYVHSAALQSDVEAPEKISELMDRFGISFAEAPLIQLDDAGGDVLRFGPDRSGQGQFDKKGLAQEM